MFEQLAENWVEVAVPALVDEETWNRAQSAKRERFNHAKRNTRQFYLLQYMLRCAVCGRRLRAQAHWRSSSSRNGIRYTFELQSPRRYYCCTSKEARRKCRPRPFINANKIEGRVWDEVCEVLKQPGVIVAGVESQLDQPSESYVEGQARTERELRDVQAEEDRLIRLYVAGKITEDQLDHQRKFIAERLENLRAKLDDYRARLASEVSKEQVAARIQEWSDKVSQGLEAMAPEERRDLLKNVVDEIAVDQDNNIEITIAIPIESDVQIAQHASHHAIHPTHVLLAGLIS